MLRRFVSITSKMSKLDYLYRTAVLSRYFVKGWGNTDNLKRLFEWRKIMSNRDTCYKLVSPDHPITIDKEISQKDCRILNGHFISPFAQLLPEIMPKEVQMARFQVVLPREWKGHTKPVCIHLAGTGDHFFWRRRTLLARPLAKEAGIGSIILENPYYGIRKPPQQSRSSLHNVSDLFVMGGALIVESLALLHWCERRGYGPLAMTGISMGGHMASLAATNWPKPISLIPCLSWSTASCVFTEGVMSDALPWKLLQDQYSSEKIYVEDFMKYIESPEKAFLAGHLFASTYADGGDALVPNFISSKQTLTSAAGDRSSDTPGDKRHDEAASSKSELRDAVAFMRGIMDEFTHLANFSTPVDPELVIFVTAEDDAYVPRKSVMDMNELWPGASVRMLSAGHIAAFLFNQAQFRKAIIDSLALQSHKYGKRI